MAVRTHRLASRWIPTLLAAVVLAACGDNPTGPWRFQRVVITPNGPFPGGRGATKQFDVAILNNLGDIVPSGGFHWTYSSSNPGVITIDENGLGTAVGVGTTQVRAQSAGLEGLVTVTVNQIPTSFAVVEGAKQSGVVGKALATPVSVKLLDAGSAPIAGQPVVFTATAGGIVGTRTGVTGTDGIVKTTWQLGTKTSDAQTLTATMGAITLNLSATPLPDVPSARRAIGTNQNGWGLEQTDTTLAVWITDKFDNPVPNVDVAWTVTTGGGSIAPVAAKTNAGGTVTAVWTLGPTGGAQAASAAASGLQAVTYAAIAKDQAIVTGKVQTTPGALTAPAAVAAQPRPAPRAAAPVEQYVPGDWIVTFEPAAVSAPPSGAPGLGSPAAIAAVEQGIQGRVAALDAAVTQPFTVRGISPATLAARVQVADPSDFDAVGSALRAQPGVRSVERNRLIQLREPRRAAAASGVPAPAPAVSVGDPYYPLQGWSYEMIGLDQAWKLTTGSATVIVAVVDDGIRPTHSDLAANLTTDGYDFVSDLTLPGCTGGTFSNAGDGGGPDSIPTIPSSFTYDGVSGCVGSVDAIGGHGLHVAGTIAAAAGATGAVGVAPKVRIRPIRVLGVAGVGTSYDIAQGILYAAGLPADNGAGGTVKPSTKAQIINLSLGGPGTSAVITAAVQAASAAGSLLIAAAGNDAVSDPFYPAALPEVISVSAVGSTGGLADYSNWGPTIDIAAPGGDASYGSTHAILSTLWNFTTGLETWNYFEGTSMAAPHVSGVAALILSKEPSLTAAQLRARLLTYATPAGNAQFFGAGIVNAFTSLTLGAGFRREPYVRLIDATTGATLQTIKVGADGTYKISHLPIGTSFRVFAGLDEDGDATIGTLGRSFGAFGGGTGATINATTTRVYDAPITIGTPSESGGNNAMGFADYVPVGGYVTAQLASGLEDWFTTTVPAGIFTFGTTGTRGGCGVAGQVNTRLELYNAVGSQVVQNDDGTAYDFCGKVTQTLTAGQYFVRVVSSATITFGGVGQTSGTYRFYIRSGS